MAKRSKRRLVAVALFALCIGAAFAVAGQHAAQFEDSTAAAGIKFTHVRGNHGPATILEEAGPGVCVADFDGDGFVDIYLVSGRDRAGAGRNVLYRNNGDGTFTDVTETARVPGTAYGLGCVWGDYDNDGHPDLYVTQYGANVLYHNAGDGAFVDVTEKAHAGATDFGTVFHSGAVFFDYDRDGLLDLYAGGYVQFGPKSKQTCAIGYGIEASCPPSAYEGSAAVLLHNNGDGTFTNATKAAGMFQPKGKNLSVAPFDYDEDGWPDLFVANDGIEFYLYHNERNGRFKEVALTSGIALMENGAAMAAMCISFGDYDRDGKPDLYVSDFQDVPDHIWRNDGKGFFEEVSAAVGIAAPTRRVLSFGGGFFDYDNDGWLDLFIANGHVYEGVDKTRPDATYRQINSLFHNEGNGKFVETTSTAGGEAFRTPRLGRGAAFADFDNDGYVDVIVANSGERPALLHNNGHPSNRFLNVKLIGAKSNRDAVGARIRITAGGAAQVQEIAGGASYLSQSDLRATFGLGTATRVDTIEIAWPSGLHETISGIDAGQFIAIREGTGTAEPQRPRPPK